MTLKKFSQETKHHSRILVIKLRHHGDMLLVTPVVHALKATYPDAKIDVLLYEETRQMLTNNPQVHRIYGIDRKWKKQGVRYQLQQEWQLLSQLRKQRYDIVLNLADQWRSIFVLAFIGAKRRIGFAFPKRDNVFWKKWHTDLVSTAEHATQHTVEQNLSILSPLGITTRDAPATMSYSAEEWRACEAKIPATFRDNYVVIQPTSRWFFKCWREKNMADVINALALDGQHVILTSGPDRKELEMVENILSGCHSDNVISLAGQFTLSELAALIDHARLFIGVDSVAMHMAAALQTPLVALFGASKLTFWHPWQAKGEVIWAGDYGPLPNPDDVDTRTSERYLDLIPSEAVINAARRLLS